MRRWQETAALRDCDRAYVRIGSGASEQLSQRLRPMSALPQSETTFVQGRLLAFPEIVRLIISKDAARRHHQRPPHAFRLELK
jgi:hypothetical protein